MAKKHRPNRNKRPCKANYNVVRKWIANKIRRITRHMKAYPMDLQSQPAIDRARTKR